jgi:hypothetical protein
VVELDGVYARLVDSGGTSLVFELINSATMLSTGKAIKIVVHYDRDYVIDGNGASVPKEVLKSMIGDPALLQRKLTSLSIGGVEFDIIVSKMMSKDLDSWVKDGGSDYEADYEKIYAAIFKMYFIFLKEGLTMNDIKPKNIMLLLCKETGKILSVHVCCLL